MYRSGRVCTLTGAVRNSSSFASGVNGVKIAQLPADVAPAYHVRTLCQGSGMARWLLNVLEGGSIWCERYGKTDYETVGAGSWLVLDATWVLP